MLICGCFNSITGRLFTVCEGLNGGYLKQELNLDWDILVQTVVDGYVFIYVDSLLMLVFLARSSVCNLRSEEFFALLVGSYMS